jgi:hypothetical protein
MPINKEHIDKIYSILIQLQPKSLFSVQILKTGYDFRLNCMLSDKQNFDGTYNFVYFNIANFNNWHKRILEKRKKEVSAQMIIETFENITRITFK